MSKEEAIKEIEKWLDGCPFENTKEAFILAIKALEEDRPQGKWIKNNNTFWTCNKCNFVNDFNRIEYSFCPNCGADMRGDKDV